MEQYRAFMEQYRDARSEKLKGCDVVFPAGTRWLHRFAGVKRAEPEATGMVPVLSRMAARPVRGWCLRGWCQCFLGWRRIGARDARSSSGWPTKVTPRSAGSA
jgi:hypothetical protein